MGERAEYINFPIQLLSGFMINSEDCMNNIFDYATYKHFIEEMEFGSDADRFIDAGKYFGIKTFGNVDESFANGEELYNSLPDKSPKVGIKISTIWDYYKNDKSEFENACLLGFLAMKSIVQNKTYCRVTNLYWLSRMDGKTKTVKDEFELSEQIRKYANRYHSDKVKTELQDNWGLKYYSRFTRGFYVSFKLDYHNLINQAERKRKSTLKKQRDKEKKLALERVLAELYSTTP